MKKRQYSLNTLVVVLLDGHIIYLSDLDWHVNDQALWKHTGLRKCFKEQIYGIVANGGFF